MRGPVAHNPDGVEALCRTIEGQNLPRPIHALVSILGEKAWPEMLVECLANGPSLFAKFADNRAPLTHRSHSRAVHPAILAGVNLQ